MTTASLLVKIIWCPFWFCDFLFGAPEPSSFRRPSSTFHIHVMLFYFSETAEQNSTKLDRKQNIHVLYQVCVFLRGGGAIGKTRWPSWSLIDWDIFNFLLGSKILMRSTKFVFFGYIGKTRWPPRSLIFIYIFNSSSETAERNSTKLNRTQDLNVFY